MYTITDEYRNRNTAGWLMRDATVANIRKLRADNGGTSGPVLWQPSMTHGLIDGAPDTFLGAPIFTDPGVASLASNARVVGFLDWSAYYVRHVGDITFETDQSYAFNADQLAARCRWRIDGDMIDLLAGASIVQNV
jgi:HK97 family phage major capsid protein